MSALRVRCPAKINLGLRILGRRPDGYHEIDTLLQAVLLEDELRMEEAPEGFALETRGIPIPADGPNLIERAWALISDRVSDRARKRGGHARGRGVRVRLTKRVPVGGGLGGGSSDAAGFLAGANRLFDLGLDEPSLRSMCVRLGSDVSFFLRGGTARGTGRGERVRHLCPLPPAWIALATPPFAVSTSWAYGRVRISLTPRGRGASILAAAVERGDWKQIAPLLCNDLEDVVLREFAVLSRLKRTFLDHGALGALLSGSGSTVFGLARTRDEALQLSEHAASCGAAARVVRTTERGVAVAVLDEGTQSTHTGA